MLSISCAFNKNKLKALEGDEMAVAEKSDHVLLKALSKIT